jgi:hypothetical protein
MNATIRLVDMMYNAYNDTWDQTISVKTTDYQYDADGYVYGVLQPIHDATTLAAYVAQIKDKARELVIAAGGPSMADSDMTLFGGPTI